MMKLESCHYALRMHSYRPMICWPSAVKTRISIRETPNKLVYESVSANLWLDWRDIIVPVVLFITKSHSGLDRFHLLLGKYAGLFRWRCLSLFGYGWRWWWRRCWEAVHWSFVFFPVHGWSQSRITVTIPFSVCRMRSFSFVAPFTQIDNGVAEGAFLVSFRFFGDFFQDCWFLRFFLPFILNCLVSRIWSAGLKR